MFCRVMSGVFHARGLGNANHLTTARGITIAELRKGPDPIRNYLTESR